jgi:flagellar basal body-associated protein FliL
MDQTKKNGSRWTIILIVAMAFAMMTSFVYAFVQQGIAKHNEMKANEYAKLAQQTELSCHELKKAYNDQLDQLRIELERSNTMLQKLDAKSK